MAGKAPAHITSSYKNHLLRCPSCSPIASSPHINTKTLSIEVGIVKVARALIALASVASTFTFPFRKAASGRPFLGSICNLFSQGLARHVCTYTGLGYIFTLAPRGHSPDSHNSWLCRRSLLTDQNWLRSCPHTPPPSRNYSKTKGSCMVPLIQYYCTGWYQTAWPTLHFQSPFRGLTTYFNTDL